MLFFYILFQIRQRGRCLFLKKKNPVLWRRSVKGLKYKFFLHSINCSVIRYPEKCKTFITDIFFQWFKRLVLKSIWYYQGRRTSQCHRAMALVVFCLASKVCYKNLPWNFPISFEASKWHWLILASIGALGYYVCVGTYILYVEL